MIKFEKDYELKNKLIEVFDIWGICGTKLQRPDKLVELVVNRMGYDDLNDEEAIKKNIEAVILEYVKDKKEYLFDLDIIIKLLFEDKSNYLNILESYEVLDNLFDYNKYPLIKEIESKINESTTICIFSELYEEKPLFKWGIWHTNVLLEKPVRPNIYELTRKYFVDDKYNKMENIYLTLNNNDGMTKLIALKFASHLKMKEFYYKDKFEEGIINTSTGVLTPIKNKSIIIDKCNTTLLQGFTSIDVFDDYNKETYKVYESKNRDNVVDFYPCGNSKNEVSENKRKRINEMIKNVSK